MINHASCDHARTPKARQACRRARQLGAETPAKPATIDASTHDAGARVRTRSARMSDAKRRLRNTLDALSRAIEQGHPKRVGVWHAVPGLDINSRTEAEVVEVRDDHLTLLLDEGHELTLRYAQIKTIEL